ncbi:squalene/phytoene synthase family protein [Pararhodobacter sp. SW119]|uniref:squalene/phytoene synthase family protein n=1 Tax=Pararhodobacter sp. SW119 TaxID=2780075 RepID=UPI001ADF24E9|nr:squalene/phytoene synthase family protein [Pararhodobacter sp. SW119]
MTPDAHVDACAELVRRGDPDRFLAVMAVRPELRAGLMVLYAFNLELARAAWITAEPLIAGMRLQFWRDVVAEAGNATPRAHEVAGPLASLIVERSLPASVFQSIIDARTTDSERVPFDEEAALWRYLEASSGDLMALAVRTVSDAHDDLARAHGTAQGLANYLLAVPALEAAGRVPLPDGRPQAVAALARDGLTRLDDAGPVPSAARPALLAAWRSRAILKQAARNPAKVGEGTLGQSEFQRRGSLLWRSLLG